MKEGTGGLLQPTSKERWSFHRKTGVDATMTEGKGGLLLVGKERQPSQ